MRKTVKKYNWNSYEWDNLFFLKQDFFVVQIILLFPKFISREVNIKYVLLLLEYFYFSVI